MLLIIPDIHDKVDVFNQILVKYNHIPQKISLGDWFDSFEYTAANYVEDTAKACADFIADPNHKMVWGNHDIQYAFPKCLPLGCSGWASWKQEPIDKWMKPNWSKVKLHQWLEFPNKNWLLSHAGFHPSFANPFIGMTKEWVEKLTDEALAAVRYENRITPILEVGSRRGGSARAIGGCTWLDWRDFKPVEGLNQVVGHTIYGGKRVLLLTAPNSENHCIDTQLRHVAILDDEGSLTIEPLDFPELKQYYN